ncbi:MAG: hypothetical protein RSC66_15415 [Comamonas sp.]
MQDADRLDAMGLIGAARCFYVGGRLGRALYDPADPRGELRPLDDTRYTLDHFQTKLLRLAEAFRRQKVRAARPSASSACATSTKRFCRNSSKGEGRFFCSLP